MGDARRIRSSVRTSILATLVSGVFQVINMVVLARLLEPSDYGFFAVSLSINALTSGFLASALERTMVLVPDEEVLHGRALLVVGALCGTAMATVATCFALSAMTGWELRIDLVALVCATQAAASIAIVPRAMLRRRFAFARINGGEVLGTIFGNGVVAIVLAQLGFGPYALAAGYVTATVIATTLVVWRPAPTLLQVRLRGASDLLRSAFAIIRVAGLEAAHGQVASIILSALLGPASLGLFNRVNSLVTLPVQLLTSSLSRVVVSAMVMVADDKDRLSQSAKTLLRAASAILGPLVLGIAGSSQAFTDTVLGPTWGAAVPIIPLMALTVWFNMVGSLLGIMAESVRLFGQRLRIQAAVTLALIVALLSLSSFGLVAVAAGAMFVSALYCLLYLRLAAKITGKTVVEILWWMRTGWLAGAACFVATNAIGWNLGGLASGAVLACQVGACAVIAALVYLLLDRPVLVDVFNTVLPGKMGERLERLLTR